MVKFSLLNYFSPICHLVFDIVTTKLVDWFQNSLLTSSKMVNRQNDSCIKINHTSCFMRYLKFFIASLFYVQLKRRRMNESPGQKMSLVSQKQIPCQHPIFVHVQLLFHCTIFYCFFFYYYHYHFSFFFLYIFM